MLAQDLFTGKEHLLTDNNITQDDIALLLACLIAPNSVENVQIAWLQEFNKQYYGALNQFSSSKMKAAMRIPQFKTLAEMYLTSEDLTSFIQEDSTLQKYQELYETIASEFLVILR